MLIFVAVGLQIRPNARTESENFVGFADFVARSLTLASLELFLEGL